MMDIKQRTVELIGHFESVLSTAGYVSHQPANICCGIDPTVRFIGSHISVLKPYLAQNTVPAPGIYLVQPCVRTRNVKRLLDDTFNPAWGSFFVSLGGISPPDRLEEVCAEMRELFLSAIGIPQDRFRIMIHSGDRDLMEAAVRCYGKDALFVDTVPDVHKYYRHRIGMSGVSGRNFNIALGDPALTSFGDVGNIIMIEGDKGAIAIEIAFGVSTILKQKYGLNHVLDCNPVYGIEHVHPAIRYKLHDTIVTSVALMREGLSPNGQHNRNRILRHYLSAMDKLSFQAGIGKQELADAVSEYELREYGTGSLSASEEITRFLETQPAD